MTSVTDCVTFYSHSHQLCCARLCYKINTLLLMLIMPAVAQRHFPAVILSCFLCFPKPWYHYFSEPYLHVKCTTWEYHLEDSVARFIHCLAPEKAVHTLTDWQVLLVARCACNHNSNHFNIPFNGWKPQNPHKTHVKTTTNGFAPSVHVIYCYGDSVLLSKAAINNAICWNCMSSFG